MREVTVDQMPLAVPVILRRRRRNETRRMPADHRKFSVNIHQHVRAPRHVQVRQLLDVHRDGSITGRSAAPVFRSARRKMLASRKTARRRAKSQQHCYQQHFVSHTPLRYEKWLSSQKPCLSILIKGFNLCGGKRFVIQTNFIHFAVVYTMSIMRAGTEDMSINPIT